MNFEFDPAKSVANQAKHGIDFKQAQELWHDPDRAVLPAISLDEPRHLMLARLRGKVWAAIFTERGERIRLISGRRARKNEENIYEQTQSEDNGGES